MGVQLVYRGSKRKGRTWACKLILTRHSFRISVQISTQIVRFVVSVHFFEYISYIISVEEEFISLIISIFGLSRLAVIFWSWNWKYFRSAFFSILTRFFFYKYLSVFRPRFQVLLFLSYWQKMFWFFLESGRDLN